MNLIEKLGLEKCRQIVDGAPPKATSVVISKCGNYALYGRVNQSDGRIMLGDLRTALADHDRIDTCTDIRNHLSPNTKVVEHE